MINMIKLCCCKIILVYLCKWQPSARDSCVFLLSNLYWFLNIRDILKSISNFVGNISRWTLTGLKQLGFTWFQMSCFRKISESGFVEHLFVHLSIIIVLHYIFDHQTKHLNIILLRHCDDIYIILCKYLLFCYKELTDLHYMHQI